MLILMLIPFFVITQTSAQHDHSVSSHKAELMMFGSDHLEIELISPNLRKVQFTISDKDRKIQPLGRFKLQVLLRDPSHPKKLRPISVISNGQVKEEKAIVILPKKVDLDASNDDLLICLKRKMPSQNAECSSKDYQPFTISALSHHDGD